MWTSNRSKDPVLQAAHAVWSLGATTAPFIVQPFLVNLQSTATLLSPTDDGKSTSSVSDERQRTLYPIEESTTSIAPTRINHSENLLSTWSDRVNDINIQKRAEAARLNLSGENNSISTGDNDVSDSSTWSELTVEGLEYVCYAYVTIGLLVLLAGLAPAVTFVYTKSPLRQSNTNQKTTKSDDGSKILRKTRTDEKYFKARLLCLVGLFYFFYMYGLSTPPSYLTSFVIKHLHWSIERGVLINSVFFGALFIGRILGIPVSAVVRPRPMVLSSVVVTLVAYLLLLLANIHGVFVWMSAILSGLGLSVTFASTVLWISEHTTVTAGITAFMMLICSVGGMTGPLIVGRLFNIAPISMVYFTVVAGVCEVVACVAMDVFLTRTAKRRQPSPAMKLVRAESTPEI